MFFKNVRRSKKLHELRNEWGKPLQKIRDLDLIPIYHQIVSQKDQQNFVDDKTWADLNFDKIYNIIDRTSSNIGQQYLYHLMHKYEKDENVLKKRFDLIQRLKNDSDLREEIQLPLKRINSTGTYFIPNIILNDTLPYTKYYKFFYLFAYLPVFLAALAFENGIFFFVVFGALLVNIILNQLYSKKIYEYFSGFSGLNSMLITARELIGVKDAGEIKELKVLINKRSMIKKLNKKIGYVVIDKDSMNDIMASMVEYSNMIFLFDIIAYYKSVHILRKYQEEMKEVYEAIAVLDSCISIASYLEEIQHYSTPVFSKERKISFENLYHPLIENPVSNSLTDLTKSVLITGSNMSGKTTFIKTIGVNLILAETLYFCLAQKFIVPKYKIKSAVNREEDLENNKSYFFVEVEELQKFIELSNSDEKFVFLIDEIFRGTNTVERLAASSAVLGYLNQNSIVFVTTHDIELQEMLKDRFEMFHFSEKVDGDNYFFDYKIRKGPCSSGNAIKLLGIKKYPQEVLDEANQIVRKLADDKNFTIE